MARKSKEANEQATMKKMAEDSVSQNVAETTNYDAIGIVNRSRCGGTLREVREKQGFSTQEIANRLRLSNKQIESLEADNFSALPEAMIIKGFIRNYAKLLKIDAEPLLDAYAVMSPSKAPQSFALKPTANVKVTNYQKPNSGRYVLIGLTLLMGLGAWFFYQHYIQKPNPINPTAALTKPNTNAVEAMPEPALPAAERTADGLSTELTLPAAPTVSTEAALANPVRLDAAANAEGVATAPAPVAPSGSPLSPQPPAIVNQALPNQTSQADISATLPTDGNRKLELSATQETWVSVRDASGKEIYTKILFAGNREVIDAKPPLNITFGNSLGATLVVDSKPVDLAPHTKANIARLQID